ncbi:MAG: ABC transporter ATP-binding protein, partial [Bacteroidota bacterium]
MIQNLAYTFRFEPLRVRRAIFWEWLHSLLLAAPSGILLLVIWELFEVEPNVNRIITVLAVMTGLFVLQLWVGKQAMVHSNLMTFEIGRKLRLMLGDKLQRLSLGYYKSRDPGDLASVMLQDVATFEGIYGHSVPTLANSIFGVLALPIFLFFLDVKLTITLLFALVLVLPLMEWSRGLVARLGKTQVQARTDVSSRLLEYFQGIQYIKAYGVTGEKFASLHQSLAKLRKESIRVEAIPGPVVLTVGIVLELFFVLMVWAGLYLLSGGATTVPILVAFLIIGYRLYEPIKILMIEYPVLSYMNVSLGRIRNLLEAKEQSVGEQRIPETYDIRFDGVSFAYVEEKQVLREMSFFASAGSLTALVGASGSGKTTITALIARFWDVQSGHISIGGVQLTDMAPQQVYSLISEVFQEVYLFDGSIYENIKIGNPNASDTCIRQAAQQAQVLEF